MGPYAMGSQDIMASDRMVLKDSFGADPTEGGSTRPVHSIDPLIPFHWGRCGCADGCGSRDGRVCGDGVEARGGCKGVGWVCACVHVRGHVFECVGVRGFGIVRLGRLGVWHRGVVGLWRCGAVDVHDCEGLVSEGVGVRGEGVYTSGRCVRCGVGGMR